MRFPAPLLFVPILLAGALAPSLAPTFARDAEVEAAKDKLGKNVTDPFEQRGRESAIRALGKLGGKDAAAALLVVFDDPFEHLRDRAVSAWITMLGGARAEATRDWLVGKALKHKNPEVRRGAATALGLTRQEAARDALLLRIGKERNEAVTQSLLAAWPAVGGKVEASVSKLIRDKSGPLAFAAAEAVVAAGAAGDVAEEDRRALLAHRHPMGRAGGVLLQQAAGGLSAGQVRAILSDKADPPKIALAESLVGDVESMPWESVGTTNLENLLADASWRVRAAAIRAAHEKWRVEVIPLLIKRLDQEDGRLKLDLLSVLREMSGKEEMGWDGDLWRGWWGAKKESFELGPRPKKDGKKRKKRDVIEDEPGGESKTAAFFKLPVVSKRIAFLLDCSGSMGNPALGEKVGGKTKMEIAREELAKTLADLDEETVFNVYLYRYPSDFPPKPKMTHAFRKLERCSSKRAKEAVAWLAKEEARGWGAFYDGLKLLFAEDVDTIFFLSDGRPSRGRYDRDFRVIDELTRDNRFRQVAIHTVLVGKSGADRKFMEQLAEATRGKFADAIPDDG